MYKMINFKVSPYSYNILNSSLSNLSSKSNNTKLLPIFLSIPYKKIMLIYLLKILLSTYNKGKALITVEIIDL